MHHSERHYMVRFSPSWASDRRSVCENFLQSQNDQEIVDRMLSVVNGAFDAVSDGFIWCVGPYASFLLGVRRYTFAKVILDIVTPNCGSQNPKLEAGSGLCWKRPTRPPTSLLKIYCMDGVVSSRNVVLACSTIVNCRQRATHGALGFLCRDNMVS